MEHIPDHAQQPERPQSLEELRCRLNRRLSDFREGWRRCDKPLCRRRMQCCGEGPECGVGVLDREQAGRRQCAFARIMEMEADHVVPRVSQPDFLERVPATDISPQPSCTHPPRVQP